jgi:hypothetical protein
VSSSKDLPKYADASRVIYEGSNKELAFLYCIYNFRARASLVSVKVAEEMLNFARKITVDWHPLMILLPSVAQR